MNLTSAIARRFKTGPRLPFKTSIRHSTFGFCHYSSQPPSHPVPTPLPGPTRPSTLKSKFLAVFLAVVFSGQTSSASISDSWNRFREKTLDKAGDKIEAEVRRARDDLAEHAKSVEAEIRRNRERLEKIGKEIVKGKDKLLAIDEEIKRTKEKVKDLAHSVGKKVEDAAERATNLEKLARGEVSPQEIFNVVTILSIDEKLKKAVNEGKIEKFLNQDVAGIVRIFDVLSPSQGLVEHLDPTGVAQKVREGVMRQASIDVLEKKARNDPEYVKELVLKEVVKALTDGNEVDRQQNLSLEQAKKEHQEAQERMQKKSKELSLTQEEQKQAEETVERYEELAKERVQRLEKMGLAQKKLQDFEAEIDELLNALEGKEE